MNVPIEIEQLVHTGAKILPLKPGSKLPLIKDWPAKATSDLKQIDEWAWRVPTCNWGMLCGPESKRWVLDCDQKNGKPGMQWLNQQILEHGTEWIDTVRVETVSGGNHLHFAWLDGLRKDNTGKVAPGVDVQALGTYVVCPPSKIGDKQYRFIDCDGEKTVAPTPAWLQELLFHGHTKTNGRPRDNYEGTKVPKGKRHDWLVKYGCKLLDLRILSFKAFYVQLLEWNAYIFEEPKSQAEVLEEAKGIWDWYQQKAEKTKGFTVRDRILSEVMEMEVDWLPGWEPYIALGTLTLMTGDPGVGKSFVALAIAAGLTKKKINVGYLSNENPAQYVLRPRFDALGGDPTHMFLVEDVETPDGRRALQLEDVDLLEALVERRNLGMLIIDPIQSYLGAHIDAGHANETRPVLDGLVKLSERRKISILILRHMTKGHADRAIYRGLGSIDFTGAVRNELLIGETADKTRRGMVHLKHNLGPQGPSLGYEITGGDEFGNVFKMGHFRWTGESDLKASDLTEPESSKYQESESKMAEAFLREILSSGPRLQAEILEAGKEAGITKRTLERTKKKLGIKSRKRADKKWEWELP